MPDLDSTPHPHAPSASYTDGIRPAATNPSGAGGTVMPHDLHAERAVIGASIRSAADHERLAVLVDAADFWFPQHQQMFEACSDLADIEPFLDVPFDTIDWNALWPITFPSSAGVRVGALAVLVDDVPVWALQRLATYGDGNHGRHAITIKRKAAERAELIALQDRILELTGGRR